MVRKEKLCLGLDSTMEGEEGSAASEYSDKGDKHTLFLPETQQKLTEKICEVSENVIAVIIAGSAIDPGEALRKHAKAIIHAWYPGAVGGLLPLLSLLPAFSHLPVNFP